MGCVLVLVLVSVRVDDVLPDAQSSDATGQGLPFWVRILVIIPLVMLLALLGPLVRRTQIRHAVKEWSGMADTDIDFGGPPHATWALADFGSGWLALDVWPAAADVIAASNAYVPVSQCVQALRQGQRPTDHSNTSGGQAALQNYVDYGVVLRRDNDIVEINGRPVYMVLPVTLVDRSGELHQLNVKAYFMDGFVLLTDTHIWKSALAAPVDTPEGVFCIFGIQVNPAKTWLVPYTQLSGFHVLSKSRVITFWLPNGFGLCFEIDVDVPHALIQLRRFRTRLDQRIELLRGIVSGVVADIDAPDGSVGVDGWVVGTHAALDRYRRRGALRLFKVLGIALGAWLLVMIALMVIFNLVVTPSTAVGNGAAIVATAVTVIAALVRIIANALRPHRNIGVDAQVLTGEAGVSEIGVEHSDRPVTAVAWPPGVQVTARCRVARSYGALSGGLEWLVQPESALLEVDGNRVRVIADDGRPPTARVLLSDGVAFIRAD